jgi:hypothetical protein
VGGGEGVTFVSARGGGATDVCGAVSIPPKWLG